MLDSRESITSITKTIDPKISLNFNRWMIKTGGIKVITDMFLTNNNNKTIVNLTSTSSQKKNNRI